MLPAVRTRMAPGTSTTRKPWESTPRRSSEDWYCGWFSVTDDGRLDTSNLDDLVNERTKLVSIVHVSNILGTVNATAKITKRVRDVGALIMLDALFTVVLGALGL